MREIVFNTIDSKWELQLYINLDEDSDSGHSSNKDLR